MNRWRWRSPSTSVSIITSPSRSRKAGLSPLAMARSGIPKEPFYLTGQVGGKAVSLHAEGERVILTREGGVRQEVDLAPPASSEPALQLPTPLCPHGAPSIETPQPEEAAPGTSPIDELTKQQKEAQS
jgi:hypothetical protein